MHSEVEKSDLPYYHKVRVVFMIQRVSVDPAAEHVYIVGSVPALGDWDITSAKQTGYSGLNSWIVEVFFEPHSVVDFKLCVMGQRLHDQLSSGDVSPSLVHREEGWFRRLRLTDVAVSVHVTYNRPDILATPLKSRVTVDGSPWCLSQENIGKQIHQRNADDIQNARQKVVNDSAGFSTEVVTASHVLDEVLHDTRQLRSSWAHLESAMIGDRTRKGEVQVEKGEDQAVKGEGRKERKKRWKKKRKETLRKLLKKYGIEEDKNDTVESDKLLAVDEVCDEEVGVQLNGEKSEQTTVETGSGGWGHVIKMAAPYGLGLGVAAAAMYLWCKQK